MIRYQALCAARPTWTTAVTKAQKRKLAVSELTDPESTGHLGYYIQHGISPVTYRTDDIGAHFDRRDSLYRSLGLPPLAFKNADVLEVAPGSGQNSLYVAACAPASLTLVEPNPTGRRDIVTAYANLRVAHTAPVLIAETLQGFTAERRFDIVICENWLGGTPNELNLLAKLASFVAPGGILVITTVPLAGFFPNIMRKLLAVRLVPANMSFEHKTSALIEAFGPHLATISNMTRSHRDWVHDCLINPHYLNVGLPLELVLRTIGTELEAMATFPRYATDWRWFKALSGPNRRFNETLLDAAGRNTLSFIDYRRTFPERTSAENAPLEAAFAAIHQLALDWQASVEGGNPTLHDQLAHRIGRKIEDIERLLASVSHELAAAIHELGTIWALAAPTIADVKGMKLFNGVFGRESVYVSLTRPYGTKSGTGQR
jgi:2-polyprenyl-3-methyl-5-hydroxy-6-metoxy-1,4-benzoquinol methylase